MQPRLNEIRRLWATGEYSKAAIGRAVGLTRVRVSQIFSEELANEPTPKSKKLTLDKAADFLGLPASSVTKLTIRGRLKGEKSATYRHRWIFSRRALEKFKKEVERPRICPICKGAFTHFRLDRITCSTKCARQHVNHGPRSYKLVKKLTKETCPDWAKPLFNRVQHNGHDGAAPAFYISVRQAASYCQVSICSIYRLVNLGLIRTRQKGNRRANNGGQTIEICFSDVRFIKNNHPRFSHPRP